MQCKLRDAGHCTLTGRMTSILWHIAEAFPLAMQGDNPKQPSSHRHCYQYLNGAKLRLSDPPNDDSRGRAAGCSLMSYPRPSLIVL